MRVVVTGGAGFIGTHSTRLLLESGHQVMVIDDLRHPCGVPVPEEVESVTAELSTAEASTAIESFRPEGIIHLAAQGGVNRSLRDPAEDARANVVATAALLRAAIASGCRRLVFASSGGAIYGRARRLPSRESDVARPLAPYGAAKLACEGYLGMYSRTFDLHYVALRYGNVYGPHQDGTGEAGVVAITSRRLLEGKPPQITGDGGQTRDFVFVGDVARANLLALSTPYQGALNIGTGRATGVVEVVASLVKAAGSTLEPEYVAARPGEVRSNFLDPSRAGRHLPWRAEVPLEAGLASTYRSFAQTSQG